MVVGSSTYNSRTNDYLYNSDEDLQFIDRDQYESSLSSWIKTDYKVFGSGCHDIAKENLI